MFSKTHEPKQLVLRSVFLFIVLFFITFNIISLLPFYINSLHSLKTYQPRPIGSEFIPLFPYLKGVPWAGYITCQESSRPSTDVAVWGPYQQAQFVLSPTILDYFHPLDYRYLISRCPDPAGQKQLRKRLSSYMTLKSFNGVSLLYRKKGL